MFSSRLSPVLLCAVALSLLLLLVLELIPDFSFSTLNTRRLWNYRIVGGIDWVFRVLLSVTRTLSLAHLCSVTAVSRQQAIIPLSSQKFGQVLLETLRVS